MGLVTAPPRPWSRPSDTLTSASKLAFYLRKQDRRSRCHGINDIPAISVGNLMR